jgi:hypothetical protein
MMKRILLVMAAFIAQFSFGQNYVYQVYVLNEGYYDYQTSQQLQPVTLGAYNPQTEVYSVVDTLENARFGSDLLVTETALYVAADQQILKYDKFTNQLMSAVSCPGVRNLGIYENKLLASRGEYLTSYDSYLHVYNADDLTFLQAFDTITGPKWASQNIVVDGTNAYVAVNNGYEWGNEKGIIGKIDMTTLTYVNEIDLGPEGKNPDNLVLQNGYLFTVNNKDWSGSSVSKVAIASQSVETMTIANAITGCGTSCLRDDKLVYQLSGENVLNEWNINLMQNSGPVSNLNMNYYDLSQDPVSGELYASQTDFFSFGKVFIYSPSNQEIHSFDAGVSPGTIAFDVRNSLGWAEASIRFTMFPNPTSDRITIGTDQEGQFTLCSSNGSVLFSESVAGEGVFDLTAIAPGIYYATFEGVFGKLKRIVVKQ